MRRAISVSELMTRKYETYDFTDEFKAAFGTPERNGVWFVWGQSGSGKTTFVLRLCKELSRFGRVAYNSLEEGASMTMRDAFQRAGMAEVGRRVVLLCEEMSALDKRLKERKSPHAVVVDSFQYTGLDFRTYLAFRRKHPDKLIIFISQAEADRPMGNMANKVMYDASLKILVKGYRAISKGRYFGEKGYYDIWPEKSKEYWGESEE